MANYSIRVDLKKLQGATVVNLKGKEATKTCLVIPIEGSGLFLGEKGCYLNLSAFQLQAAQYGETHCVKVQHDKAVFDAMTEEQRRAQPIIGGLHEIVPKTPTVTATAEVADDEDLPF